MMRVALTVCAVLSLVPPAKAEWFRIGNGPTLDYALAYCDNLSMGVGQPGFVFGDPAFVGGAMLGMGIRRLIDQSRFKQNCMVMNGWKWQKTKNDTPVRQRRNFNNSPTSCQTLKC